MRRRSVNEIQKDGRKRSSEKREGGGERIV
jgi:hypothetical protein